MSKYFRDLFKASKQGSVKEDIRVQMEKRGLGNAPSGPKAMRTASQTNSASDEQGGDNSERTSTDSDTASDTLYRKPQRGSVEADAAIAELQARIADLERTVREGILGRAAGKASDNEGDDHGPERKLDSSGKRLFLKLKINIPDTFEAGQVLRLRYDGIAITIDPPADASPGTSFVFELPRRTLERLKKQGLATLDLTEATAQKEMAALKQQLEHKTEQQQRNDQDSSSSGGGDGGGSDGSRNDTQGQQTTTTTKRLPMRERLRARGPPQSLPAPLEV